MGVKRIALIEKDCFEGQENDGHYLITFQKTVIIFNINTIIIIITGLSFLITSSNVVRILYNTYKASTTP